MIPYEKWGIPSPYKVLGRNLFHSQVLKVMGNNQVISRLNYLVHLCIQEGLSHLYGKSTWHNIVIHLHHLK